MFIELIPVFEDNYIFLGRKDSRSRNCFVVDPGDADPVIEILNRRLLTLDYILLTHHHADHTGGVKKIREHLNCQVVGNIKDAARLPSLDIALDCDRQDFLKVWDYRFQIFDVSGHTAGHIAYYLAEENILFCGDTLFSLGCGRIFDGSVEQLFKSLQKLKTLPDQTLVYCTHEYTLSNGKFAQHLDPKNQELRNFLKKCVEKLQKGEATIPSIISVEKALNPFLQTNDLEHFRTIRRLKDQFRL